MTDGFDDFGLPPLGHNAPPEPTALERVRELIPACDEWTAKGEITSEDDARLCTEFLEQLRRSRAALVEQRAADLKPFEEQVLVITTLYKHPLAKLDLALERIQGSKKITGLLAAYIAKKRQRELDEAEARRREAEQAERIAQAMKDKAAVSGTIDDELAAQQAVETADQVVAAAAKPPTRTRVKGDLSTRATSLREYWSAKIVDWKEARRHYRRNERVVKAYDEAVQMVANDDARRIKDPAKAPPGVEFQKREQAQ